MAKWIKILAASIGGGLVLGAGIRLGEAIAAQIPTSGLDSGGKLAERLGELENRLQSLEAESPAAAGSPMSHSTEPEVDILTETNVRLRGELRDWLEESVTVRMAEVEERLRAESERGQKQMLDAFAESVQTRVIQRISKLEEEVSGQSAAMSELRDCSLRTERSVHKLLGGLDSLLIKNMPASEEAVNPAPVEPGPQPAGRPEPRPVVEPPAFDARTKSSRWKIFG